jgi:hypothetical protein
MNAWCSTLTKSKVTYWMLVVPVICISIAYGLYARHLLAMSSLMSANAIVDPLVFILSYLIPVSVFGAIGLGFLWRRRLAKGWTVALAVVLVLVCAVALVAFGVHGFRGSSWHLSDLVWWLKPLGRIFEI